MMEYTSLLPRAEAHPTAAETRVEVRRKVVIGTVVAAMMGLAFVAGRASTEALSGNQQTQLAASPAQLRASTSCAACDGLTDKECLSTLDAEFTGLSDKSRLSYARDVLFTDGQSICDGLTDKACLSALDSAYADLSDKSKLSLLEAACDSEPMAAQFSALAHEGLDYKQGKPTGVILGGTSKFSVQAHEGLEYKQGKPTGVALGGTSQFSAHAHEGLEYKQGKPTGIQGLSESISRPNSDTDYKQGKLTGIGAFSATSKTTNADADCTACESLSDKECLAKLDSAFTSLSDKARLSYAREALPSEVDQLCSGLSDKACLATIDSTYDELSDKSKLTLLETACATDPIPVDTMELNAATTATGTFMQGEGSLLTNCFGWPTETFSEENSVLGVYGQQPYLTRRSGDPAVDFTVEDINGNSVNLKELLATKPVVMIFGMQTCPVTHLTLGHERNLTKMWSDKVHFLHVYSMDPHPMSPEKNPDIGQVWEFGYSTIERPSNYSGRFGLAKATAGSWNLDATVIVDELTPKRNNPLWCTYGPAPRSAHLIRQDGIIELAQTWMDGSNRNFMAESDEMSRKIEKLLKGDYKNPPLETYGQFH